MNKKKLTPAQIQLIKDLANGWSLKCLIYFKTVKYSLHEENRRKGIRTETVNKSGVLHLLHCDAVESSPGKIRFVFYVPNEQKTVFFQYAESLTKTNN